MVAWFESLVGAIEHQGPIFILKTQHERYLVGSPNLEYTPGFIAGLVEAKLGLRGLLGFGE